LLLAPDYFWRKPGFYRSLEDVLFTNALEAKFSR
jgi:hypothetical protein